MRSSRRICAIFTCAAVALTAAAIAPTGRTPAAASSPATMPSAVDASSPLALPGADGGASAQAFSPAGCEGTTTRPWQESRAVQTFGDTSCDYPVGLLTVDTTLYRSRWWGWERMANERMEEASDGYVFAHPRWWPCRGQHEYQGLTYHRSDEASGTYTAWTGAKATLNCG
jgi:hypothetical protein